MGLFRRHKRRQESAAVLHVLIEKHPGETV
jgi:hypothetical protein